MATPPAAPPRRTEMEVAADAVWALVAARMTTTTQAAAICEVTGLTVDELRLASIRHERATTPQRKERLRPHATPVAVVAPAPPVSPPPAPSSVRPSLETSTFRCRRCGDRKPLGGFPVRGGRRHHTCHECVEEITRTPDAAHMAFLQVRLAITAETACSECEQPIQWGDRVIADKVRHEVCPT